MFPFNPKDIKEIKCGDAFSVILTECGELFVVGSNTFGQLGLGNWNAYESNWKKVPVNFRVK